MWSHEKTGLPRQSPRSQTFPFCGDLEREINHCNLESSNLSYMDLRWRLVAYHPRRMHWAALERGSRQSQPCRSFWIPRKTCHYFLLDYVWGTKSAYAWQWVLFPTSYMHALHTCFSFIIKGTRSSSVQISVPATSKCKAFLLISFLYTHMLIEVDYTS